MEKLFNIFYTVIDLRLTVVSIDGKQCVLQQSISSFKTQKSPTHHLGAQTRRYLENYPDIQNPKNPEPKSHPEASKQYKQNNIFFVPIVIEIKNYRIVILGLKIIAKHCPTRQ